MPPKRRRFIQSFDVVSDSDGEGENSNVKRLKPKASPDAEHVSFQQFHSNSRKGKWGSLALPVLHTSNTIRSSEVEASLPDLFEWKTDPSDPAEAFYFDGVGMTDVSWLDPGFTKDPALLDDLGSLEVEGRASNNPLHIWESDRDQYLEELLRLEGRGDFQRSFCVCGPFPPRYRCVTCLSNSLWCEQCIISRHHQLPLHNIQEWTGLFFKSTTLAKLGLRVQLGDHSTSPCHSPRLSKDFVILHVNGIHIVNLEFCDCEQAPVRVLQLLRYRLYPATSTEPQTAATFEVLSLFQMLTFMSKVSAYEFYHSLARLTDNTGTNLPPDRYKSFLCMLRQWRHLRMMKRFGRGHTTSGVNGTSEGECAVLCPACPHPDINLPVAYHTEADAWKYALFLAFDGNFRLKRFNLSSDERDPGLNRGYAFCVEDKRFHAFLNEFQDVIKEEPSNCNEHKAVINAQTRGRKIKMGATGIGTIDCARHGYKRPTSLCDFQLGERQINIDYILMLGLRSQRVNRLILSYDVICQWAMKLDKRLKSYSTYDASLTAAFSELNRHGTRFVVPKYHLRAHVDYCKTRFDFHLTPGVGLTDGEAPERGWAAANGLANSTKEMGPSHRRDVLDDFFGDFNWRKSMSIARSLHQKLRDARENSEQQVFAFQELSKNLPADIVKEWEDLVVAWEKDPNAKGISNPYDVTVKAVTVAAVRKQLAEEEAQTPKTFLGLDSSITPSMMIIQGIELEEFQAKYGRQQSRLGQHPTRLQESLLLESRNRLQRKITTWFEVQQYFIPAAALLRAKGSPAESPADIPLLLPSGAHAKGLTLSNALLRLEFRLRIGEANDTLAELRRVLLTRDRLYVYKDTYVRSQRESGRANSTIQTLHDRIKSLASRYRRARAALEQLSKHLLEKEWKNEFLPLSDSDCKGLKWGFGPTTSESKKDVSWIWRKQGVLECEDAVNDTNGKEALRIEWCRMRARSHRAKEECVLLVEEIRRVEAFFTYEIELWRRRAAGLEWSTDPVVREGRIAYAERQAAIRRQLLQAATSVKLKPKRQRVLPAMEMNSGDEAAYDSDGLDAMGAKKAPEDSFLFA